MRAILVLGLLATLGTSANAATVHHHRHHVAARSNQGVIINSVPGFAYAPAPYRPELYNDQPSPYDNRFPNWGG